MKLMKQHQLAYSFYKFWYSIYSKVQIFGNEINVIFNKINQVDRVLLVVSNRGSTEQIKRPFGHDEEDYDANIYLENDIENRIF